MCANKIDMYRKYEPCFDTVSFVGAELVGLMIRQVSVLSPAGCVSLLSAGTGALALTFAKKLTQPNTDFKRLAVMITTLSLNAILISTLSTSFAITLTMQSALRSALVGLVLKVATEGTMQIFSIPDPVLPTQIKKPVVPIDQPVTSPKKTENDEIQSEDKSTNQGYNYKAVALLGLAILGSLGAFFSPTMISMTDQSDSQSVALSSSSNNLTCPAPLAQWSQETPAYGNAFSQQSSLENVIVIDTHEVYGEDSQSPTASSRKDPNSSTSTSDISPSFGGSQERVKKDTQEAQSFSVMKTVGALVAACSFGLLYSCQGKKDLGAMSQAHDIEAATAASTSENQSTNQKSERQPVAGSSSPLATSSQPAPSTSEEPNSILNSDLTLVTLSQPLESEGRSVTESSRPAKYTVDYSDQDFSRLADLFKNHGKEEGQPKSEEIKKGQESNVITKAINYFKEHSDPAKMEKYRMILDEYQRILRDEQVNFEEIFGALALIRQPNEMQKHLKRALEILIFKKDPKTTPDYVDDRTRRYFFIQALRNAIEKKNDQIQSSQELTEFEFECHKIITKLSRTVFQPKIYSYLKKVTDLFTNQKDWNVREQNYVGTILKLIEKIKKAPDDLKKPGLALHWQKFCGAMGIKDFIATENTAYIRNRYTFKNEKTDETQTIDFCRHGSPTTAGSTWRLFARLLTQPLTNYFSSLWDANVRTGEAVAPEYEEMLHEMESKGEAVLYCNHQRRWRGGVENEADRVEALEKLEDTHKNFFILSQSVEGDLFKKEQKTFDQLKAAVINSFQMNDDKAQNRLPKALQDNEQYMTEDLPNLLRQVHKILFNEKSKIKGHLEQLIFLEAFYALQRDDMMMRLSNDTYKIAQLNTTCKDFLDRGGDQATNQDIAHYYMLGDHPTSKQLIQTVYNLLAAPILVKKQAPIVHRIVPGLAFAKYLSCLPSEAKKDWQAIRFDGWKIAGVEVPGADEVVEGKGKKVVSFGG